MRWDAGWTVKAGVQMDGAEADLDIFGLKIWVVGRQFPDAGDYWDGNWLQVEVHMAANGAQVEATGTFVRSDEIAAFLDGLEVMNRELSGKAELLCMEPNLNVAIAFEGPLGNIRGIVEITPEFSNQFHRFQVGGNPSDLPKMITECRRVLSRFPVVGRPG